MTPVPGYYQFCEIKPTNVHRVHSLPTGRDPGRYSIHVFCDPHSWAKHIKEACRRAGACTPMHARTPAARRFPFAQWRILALISCNVHTQALLESLSMIRRSGIYSNSLQFRVRCWQLQPIKRDTMIFYRSLLYRTRHNVRYRKRSILKIQKRKFLKRFYYPQNFF